jgi:hypothetical protein
VRRKQVASLYFLLCHSGARSEPGRSRGCRLPVRWLSTSRPSASSLRCVRNDREEKGESSLILSSCASEAQSQEFERGSAFARPSASPLRCVRNDRRVLFVNFACAFSRCPSGGQLWRSSSINVDCPRGRYPCRRPNMVMFRKGQAPRQRFYRSGLVAILLSWRSSAV